MTNVHVFDGNLLNTLLPYRSKLLEISKMNSISKKDYINKFKELFSVNAKKTIDIICSLNGNDETSNMLNALDVLYLALTVDLEDSYLKNLDEQLSDVVGSNGGTCPSGRTTRIIQLYIQFVESKDMNLISNDINISVEK